jgi:hypothetical protein
MLGALLTLFAVGLGTLIVIGLVLSVIGTVFSLAIGTIGFLLLKVAPIMFVGWVVLKLLDRGQKRSELSSGDHQWLES